MLFTVIVTITMPRRTSSVPSGYRNSYAQVDSAPIRRIEISIRILRRTFVPIRYRGAFLVAIYEPKNDHLVSSNSGENML